MKFTAAFTAALFAIASGAAAPDYIDTSRALYTSNNSDADYMEEVDRKLTGYQRPGTPAKRNEASFRAEEVDGANLLQGILRGGFDHTTFARRLNNPFSPHDDTYPAAYDSTGCLGDQYKDKCANCMCLKGGIGNPVQTKTCDLKANPDGQDHCVDKKAKDEMCNANYECLTNSCVDPQGNSSGNFYKCA